ncbi:lyase family protein [Roseinatronobacter alkalisoli]|uniref:Lyase family protein n=1 Tax=Roseinatronobacter alkalisoli TaxID=3028235 RepID=A0ABT5T374_9RHOB|nr:lyase family protein [Roseinatronobacter sp. HJB301]MDD7969569.1 lyase family protein [Roseinatronobacter sp. HJB301]
MTPSPFDSALLGPLLGDADMAEILSETRFTAHMVAVEGALARACGTVGLIPQDSAARISDALLQTHVAPRDLGAGTAAAGVPVPALVKRLQAELGPDGQFLHWGATSQDIVDCAHILQWRDALTLLATRVTQVLDLMQTASTAHARTLMAGRTRSQVATPISFGLRIATWAQPLIALEAALPDLRARLLRVQFGGASGSASAVGGHGAALSAALAQELHLADAPCWHTDRSAIIALGGWLTAVSAALAKAARDLVIMGRSEIAEARAGQGGGSSTMPQKSNPVGAEAIITLADWTTCLQPALARAASPLEERDGAAWALEWLALPQMGMATAAALRHATELMASLKADPASMSMQLDAGHGAALAEAASFALAAHMPRPKAQELVKNALALAQADGISLPQALDRLDGAKGLADWAVTLSAQSQLAASEAMRTRIFAQRT